MLLYHYTCGHVRRALGRRGMLHPHPQPTLGGVGLLWLTDQSLPDRAGLGLTSAILACDRLAYRYVVSEPDPIPWHVWKMSRSIALIARLESVPGARPALWYVLEHSTLGILDRTYAPAAADPGYTKIHDRE